MSGPRDRVQGLAVPVNPWTGQPITDVQAQRIDKLREAGEALDAVLCELGGTQPGSPKGSRNLAHAATQLDDAVMWALKDVLEGSP